MNFPPLKNDLILRAARGEKVERVPVWIMRQAGRYLPEFRELRSHHDFFTICQTPQLACEVTLQPLSRFELDAAIIFSDILVIPQALGMTVEMKNGIGPFFPEPLSLPKDIEKLNFSVNVNEALKYVFEAITLSRIQLKGKVPLIGFSGAPFTLMSYMIEGQGSKTLSKAKKWLYTHSSVSHKLLSLLTEVIVEYLMGQIRAGAQLLQVFESHAEHLGPELFREFSLDYLRIINKRVHEKCRDDSMEVPPMIVFAKGAHYALKDLAALNYEVVGLDWTMSPLRARESIPNRTLQGNMDPCALYAENDDMEKIVQKMVRDFGDSSKWIANLGHGIYPDVDPEKLKYFIELIHKYTSK